MAVRRTKIICTMGPAVASEEKITQLVGAGMNVARLNFSHGTHEEHARTIAILKKVRSEQRVPLGMMLDTKGPEIRIGAIEGGSVAVTPGQRVTIDAGAAPGTQKRWPVHPAAAIDAMQVGTRVLIDDGYLSARVVEKGSGCAVIEVENSGLLKSHKSLALPGTKVDLPSMTEQDVLDITFGCQQGIDLIAASFIRSAEHVLELKRLLVQVGRPEVPIFAKIENQEGVRNFDTIVQVADGIMVARGDLGIELPITQIPTFQKMMIRKCHQYEKPVVTATQMLESMIAHPRPTRAEVSDVANAVYDGSSAVMLSGETAVGQYPVETVDMMRSVIEEAEQSFDYRTFFYGALRRESDVSSSVASSSIQTAYSAGAKAIFVFTSSGFTARLVSSFHPEMPVIALSPVETIYHAMSILWGVLPVDPVAVQNVHEAFTQVSCFALAKGLVHFGDLVVVTAGVPFGVSGTTNMMIVESIGDVLVRAHGGEGKKIHGRIGLLLSSDPEQSGPCRDRIVVLSQCNAGYAPLLEGALGIVLQNLPEDTESEAAALAIARALHIPIVTCAEHAVTLLKEGQLVTLDPSKAIVYKGSIGSDEEMLQQLCAHRLPK